MYGEAPGNAVRFTGDLLMRDLSLAANGGGYLTESVVPGVIPALTPYSVALRMGAQRLRVEQGNVHLPTGGAATTSWLSSATATAPDAAIAFGDSVATPKMLSVLQTVSRQLLLQSAADVIVPQMQAAAAAAAVDAAAIGGSGGSGQPLGVANTPGVGAFTGASLDDWSSLAIIEWGTPAVEVDPYSSFKSGVVGVRLLVLIDVIVQRLPAFSVASSIT